jgi:hypothetical protein
MAGRALTAGPLRQGQMYPPQRVALMEQSQPVSSQL